jgi:nucleotide-binding universal stress UspA family protein
LEEFKRILVPIDGSRLSTVAFDKAVSLALLIDGNVTIVNVVDDESPVLGGIQNDVVDERKREAMSMLDRYMQRGRDQGLEVRSVIKTGDPADRIIEMSTHFDLIIMGSLGMGKIAEIVLGSVVEKVSHRACCPVMIIRDNTEKCSRIRS